MKSFLSHVALATCLPSLTLALYQEAFVVEFDGTAQLTPETLNSQVQVSLATIGLECNASSRYHFTHSVFQGASFDLKCNKDKVSPKTVLSSVQNICGVKKAWPVTRTEPASGGQNFDRRFEPYARPGASHPLHSRDDQPTGALSPHTSTGVSRLHAANITGSGLRIAVVDSGFDVDVPGFSGTAITYSHDLTDNDSDVRDDCSFHGTHVLGVLGAKGDESRYGMTGVAPDASYELYRIQPCGRSGDTDMLINAFLEAADRGVDIISCSFGGGQTFPEDAWSAVATRLFENGTYISLPSGNLGPGIFSGISPGMADSITAVGSSDNLVTPFLTWEGNWTAATGGKTLRFVPGMPFNFPANNQLTIWSPNEKADISTECQLLPDASDLPADLSNTVLLAQYKQCWTDSTGASVSLTNALGIPYVIYYTLKDWTAGEGHAFVQDNGDPDLKGVALVEHAIGVELLESFHKDKSTKIHLAHDASIGNPAVENRPNNLTGDFVSSFSSWGPALTTRSMPQFVAPGGNILSTFPSKYGGYGVVGGTSQATPFAAGVAALVKQQHPDYSPEEIQAVIATTARPLKWNNNKGEVSDFLAPVYQQGGGFVDAWNAVHSTTVLSTSSLSFNDTANRSKELSFTIKNTGTAAITYQLSHVGAGSGYVLQASNGYNFTKAEAFPTYADISITPPTLKLEPGQSSSVSVAVTKEPELADSSTRVSYFGGYVAIQADGSPDVNNFTLPYTGFGAPLSSLPIINRDESYLMSWNITSSAPMKIEEGRTFTCVLDTSADVPASFADNMYPGVWIAPVLQSRSMSISIVDAVTDKEVVRSWQTSSAETWGPADDWYWDGSDADKTFVPEGTYIWRIQSQKLNGDPNDVEVYDTGKWVLKYASNDTNPTL